MTKEEREKEIREKVLENAPADMKREEAIARIQEHMIAHKMKEPRAILISKALDMAVNALKQEPCKDAISRSRLKECFHRNVVNGEAFDDLIDAQPSVTPTREHGEWIKQYENDGGWHSNDYWYDMYKCSKCGNEGRTTFNYCPSCGADMRKEAK